MTISFKVSDATKEKMIEHFQDLKRDKTPQYAIFQADEEDTVVTLYESGKVVFQGVSADIDAEFWKETEKILTGSFPEEKEKKKKEEPEDNTDYYFISSIGSDEVGTGDYFGPIIVTASFVSKSDITFLEELGVRDSKKVTDDKIMKIAPTLIEKIPHSTFILGNEEYNNWQAKGYNMNKIKSILHNRAILGLLKQGNFSYDMVVMDQFTPARNYFGYLKDVGENVFRKITFTTKAEDKCLSVGCSSIISRYKFINEMDKLGKKYNTVLPLGASTVVDDEGKKLVNKYGKDVLNKIAKVNFKNTEKILNN
ncbi:MAG: ribonuclease HIII [Bacilli bacterium]|nr:ribonuclease HIII [Bacilli bacterium]